MKSELDLFFRGDRDYIQGSLVIAQAAAWCRKTRPDGSPELFLTNADFRKIIECHCWATDDPDEVEEGQLRGTLRLGDRAQYDKTLSICADPGRPETPRRVPDESKSTKSFQLTSEFSADATYAHAGTFEDMIATIIEINKRCHSETIDQARNIWFLSFSSEGMPISDENYGQTGRVIVKNQTSQEIRGRVMTINEVSVTQDSGQDLKLSLVYSCEHSEDANS